MPTPVLMVAPMPLPASRYQVPEAALASTPASFRAWSWADRWPAESSGLSSQAVTGHVGGGCLNRRGFAVDVVDCTTMYLGPWACPPVAFMSAREAIGPSTAAPAKAMIARRC